MGLHVSERINAKVLDALVTLPKGFIVTLPGKHSSHLGYLTLINQSNGPPLAILLTLSLPTWLSLESHLTYLESESKYEAKIEDVLL